MPKPDLIEITDPTGALAAIAPELGGWLLRYARPTAKHGLMEALHFSQAVVDRYPKEMWAGNPLLFPMVSFNHLPGREHHFARRRRGASGAHAFGRIPAPRDPHSSSLEPVLVASRLSQSCPGHVGPRCLEYPALPESF